MAYCTPDDIGQLLSTHTLVQLTQDVSVDGLTGGRLPNAINDKVLDSSPPASGAKTL
ncbi:hypothetical protein [Arsenophonus endosymbiont of Crataerina pallida]|uniref:hypothetical protein n=1 Tax=Arsenophonus endosymbiont of Crataerina pallida TaxID=3066235 RepID=UPI0030D3ECCE